MSSRRDVAHGARGVAAGTVLWCWLPLLLASVACSSAPTAVAERVGDEAENRAAEAPAALCADLSELACLDSTQCTLRQQESGEYACTEPESDCELGFAQRAPRETDCAEGCTLVPARCYCAPDVDCFCGGGPPAMCVAEDDGGAEDEA